MSELASVVSEALNSDEELRRDQVVEWCRTASDLEALALLYELTRVAYGRIRPELGQQETCALIRRYLLECVRLDPKAEGMLSRYEATQTLLSWLWHLSGKPNAEPVLLALASDVTEAFLAGDEAVREAIETGFLEHALEEDEYRPLFASWAEHDQLRAAHAAALEWGLAHAGFTRGLWRDWLKK